MVFLLSHLIPLRGLFLLRTSAIQASLIALGLASVLISPFIAPLSPPAASSYSKVRKQRKYPDRAKHESLLSTRCS